MTIKLMLLKSGEDIITDVSEMCVGTEENKRVIGYYMNRPCIVKMVNPNVVKEDAKEKKAGYEVTMFPWIPLTPDEDIPVPADWVITMVNPTAKLKEMYIEDIVNYGKDNQSDSADEQRETCLLYTSPSPRDATLSRMPSSA